MGRVSVERIGVTGARFEIDVKRLRLPFLVTAHCPNCGYEVESDLAGQDHLSYPSLGVPEDFAFTCPDGAGYDGCGHDWTEKLVLDVTLVPFEAPPPKTLLELALDFADYGGYPADWRAFFGKWGLSDPTSAPTHMEMDDDIRKLLKGARK